MLFDFLLNARHAQVEACQRSLVSVRAWRAFSILSGEFFDLKVKFFELLLAHGDSLLAGEPDNFRLELCQRAPDRVSRLRQSTGLRWAVLFKLCVLRLKIFLSPDYYWKLMV